MLGWVAACSGPEEAVREEALLGPGHQVPHPDLGKLKLYRTYYHVQLESPTAHQFEVWYQSGEGAEDFREWNVFHVAASESSDTSQIKHTDYLSTHQIFVGFPAPPEKFTPVPQQLGKLEEGIRKAVMRNHADLGVKKIQVHYHGSAARVLAYELIPIGAHMAIQGFRFCFADLQKGTYRESGSGMNGIGLLALKSATEVPVTDPIWIDFVLPEAIQGSSLFSVESAPELGPVYRNSEKELMKRLLATAGAIERGEALDSSVGRVLRKQGGTLLPLGIRQYLEFNIDLYGRTADFHDQLSRHFSILIPASEKPFTLEKKDTETGIKCVVTGNLEEGRLSLEVQGPDGTTRRTDLVSDSATFKLIKDGPRTASKGPLYTQPEATKLSLPGQGKYYQFDIHPNSHLYPSRFTGERQE